MYAMSRRAARVVPPLAGGKPFGRAQKRPPIGTTVMRMPKRSRALGSLGDDTLQAGTTPAQAVATVPDCSDPNTWATDPYCQAEYPVTPNTTTPAPNATTALQNSILNPANWTFASAPAAGSPTNATQAYQNSILNPDNWTFSPATPGAPPVLLIAGAVGVGVYLIFASGKSKAKK